MACKASFRRTRLVSLNDLFILYILFGPFTSAPSRLRLSLTSTKQDVKGGLTSMPRCFLPITRSFGRSGPLLVIKGIGLVHGESYVSAQTMYEIERIKVLRKSVAVARQVPVAMFHVQSA